MLAMETTVTTLTDQLNTYSGEIARLMKIIEENDSGTKQVIQTEISGIQTQITGIESAGTALEGRLTGLTTGIDQRVSAVESATLKIGQDLGTLNDGVTQKMAEIDQFMTNTGDGTKGKSEWEDRKPLMEYKMIE